jgi:hypothetical protein
MDIINLAPLGSFVSCLCACRWFSACAKPIIISSVFLVLILNCVFGGGYSVMTTTGTADLFVGGCDVFFFSRLAYPSSPRGRDDFGGGLVACRAGFSC